MSAFSKMRQSASDCLKSSPIVVIGIFAGDAAARVMLLVLMLTVIHFIIVDFLFAFQYRFGYTDQVLPNSLRISADRSFPEYFNYAQTIAAVVLLVMCWKRTRIRLYLFWAWVFAIVVLDDSLRWHERAGAWLVEQSWVGALPGLRAQDSGELLLWAGLALSLALPLAWALRQPASRRARRALVFVPLFGMLVFFALVVDMLHILASGARILGYVEDGGEMITLAIVCGTAFAVYRSYRRPPAAPPWNVSPTRTVR